MSSHPKSKSKSRDTCPLTPAQRRSLFATVRRAYDHQLSSMGLIEPGTDIDNWRHEVLAEAGLPSSIKMATHADYGPMKCLFERLAGRIGAAYSVALECDQTPRDRAEYTLRMCCELRGVAFPGYPAAIGRRKFGCELKDCTPSQLMQLLYTVTTQRKPVTA
jgi:hypothetical protein